MARRADTYAHVEDSTVKELAELLADHIRLFTCPLFMDVGDWQKVCCGLPRVSHLVATSCGFKLEKQHGDTYERPAPLPLGKAEKGVELNSIRRLIEAVIHAHDPAGILWTMKSA